MNETTNPEGMKKSPEGSELSPEPDPKFEETPPPDPVNESAPDSYEGAHESESELELSRFPLRSGNRRRRLVKPEQLHRQPLTAKERLLLFDTWRRSKLPAPDFAVLVGLTSHTLYEWRRRFEKEGPAGLADRPRGCKPGSRLPEVTRRSILMLKEDNPEWACRRTVVVIDPVTKQRFGIRTEPTVLEVRLKDPNELRAARPGAFLCQVVLKRFNDRRRIDRAFGIG